MAHEARIRLSIVDLQGRTVAVLADGVRGVGRYAVAWTGQGSHGQTSAGLYFVRYDANGKSYVRRLMLTR